MICIIGGGIAGLYAAKRLMDVGIENVIVLEAEETVGGRARMARFRGIPVVCGAGIGRARDRRLRRLLREFGIPENRFRVKVLRGDASLRDLARRVRESREYRAAPRAPFGKLAAAVLGKKRYAAFLEKSLYTNFERDDATDVILDYGVNDNAGGWTGLAVSWTALIRALSKKVGVVTKTRVTAIERLPDGSFVVRADGFEVRCETVVLATTVDVVRRLLANGPFGGVPEYRGIFGQPFIRVYAAFDAPSAAILRSLVPATTIVSRPLKKIIPMSKNKNVFMIAYADNADAEAVHAIETDVPLLARMVAEAVDAPAPLRILEVQSHYWPIGTHGFGPLPKKYADRAAFLRAAQRPAPGVFVVGEMVSTNQGWVEGALESVDAVVKDLIIYK